jgi:nucleoside diphosphate kinase
MVAAGRESILWDKTLAELVILKPYANAGELATLIKRMESKGMALSAAMLKDVETED